MADGTKPRRASKWSKKANYGRDRSEARGKEVSIFFSIRRRSRKKLKRKRRRKKKNRMKSTRIAASKANKEGKEPVEEKREGGI